MPEQRDYWEYDVVVASLAFTQIAAVRFRVLLPYKNILNGNIPSVTILKQPSARLLPRSMFLYGICILELASERKSGN